MRVRMRFAKTETMRYTGHLDVYRTLHRTLIRAGLPIAHSQGYARRPKLNLAAPLPLGFTSDWEVADLWLEQPVPLEQLTTAIQAASPPGLRLLDLEEVPLHWPKLTRQVLSSEYICTLLERVPDLEQRIDTLLAADSLPRERRGKRYDLRPLVLALQRMGDDEQGRQRLRMTLQSQEGKTGRPDEVVAAMGIDPVGVRFHRSQLNFSDDKE